MSSIVKADVLVIKQVWYINILAPDFLNIKIF